MKNLAIELDAEMIEFLRKEAEKRGVTLEQYVDTLVQECIKEAMEYEKARRAFIEMMKHPFGGELESGRLPTRDEIYD